MKTFTIILSIMVIAAVGAPIKKAFADTELEELVQTALQANPQILARQARADASQERIPQAASLEDPRIGVRATNLPLSDFGLGNTPMSGIDFSLAQKVPFPGKLKYRKGAEQAESEAVKAVLQEVRNQVRFKVSQAYYELYRIDKEIHVVRENRALLRSLANTAEARYTTGASKGPDVFRAQTFTSELDNILLALEQERSSAAIQLNTLLNAPAETPRRLKYRFKVKKPPSEQAWQDAIKDRPLIKAFSHQVDAADQRIRLAKRDYWPDFDFSVSYRLRESSPGDPVNGSDFISGGVTLNLPLWAHWRETRKVKENVAHKIAAEQSYQSVQNESTYEAMDAYRRIVRQYRQVGIFNSRLLPQSRATYATSLTGYESEQVDFFSTIEALKEKHEMELAYYEIKASYQISQARLKWVLGQASMNTMTQEVSQ